MFALWRYWAVATIQIRELPEDVYETIRQRARAAGQSIQIYMRDQVIELAGRRTKQEAWAAVESGLIAENSRGAALEDIGDDLADDPGDRRVVDASVLACALIGRTSDAAHLRAALSGTDCHAPHLIDAELGKVLRERTRSEDVTPQQARTALRAARRRCRLPVPHVGALAELAWIWRNNLSFYDLSFYDLSFYDLSFYDLSFYDLSFYDALYVALAVRVDVPLVTGDRRLSRAPGLLCAIELV